MAKRILSITLLIFAGSAVLISGAFAQDRAEKSPEHLSFEALVQPRIAIEPKRPYADSSLTAWDVHRAKLEFTGRATPGKKHLDITGKVSFDLVEKRPLQNAYLAVRVRPWLNVQTGRFKPDFGYDFSRSNDELLIIERSYLSTFLKDEENGSRLYGLELSGKILKGLSYSLGYFDGPNFAIKAFEPFEFVCGRISYKFADKALFALSTKSEMIELHPLLKRRSSAVDIACAITPVPRLYCEAEWFYGDAQLPDYLPEVFSTDGFVSLSLRLLARYGFPVGPTVLSPVVSVEHLDGFAVRQAYTLGFLWELANRLNLYTDFSTVRYQNIGGFQSDLVEVQLSYLFKQKMQSERKNRS